MEVNFNFLGADADYEDFISFRVNLRLTPTYELLQRILYDLYLQRRLEPQYLFMAQQDIKALTKEILASRTFYPVNTAVQEFRLEQSGNDIQQISSRAL